MNDYFLNNQQKWIKILFVFHLIIIVLSNYLVQIPVNIFGFDATLGMFSYPFIFFVSDFTIRLFNAQFARKIVLCAMFPALFLSYLISTFFYQGKWMGFLAILEFNSIVARVALASFLAYFLGQFVDIFVFNSLRKFFWWIAPFFAAIFGNAIDSIIFFFIAFFKSADPFLAEHWIEIGIADYLFKICVCILFGLPIYKIVTEYLLEKVKKNA